MSGALRLLATEQAKGAIPARNRLAGSMGRESVRCSGSAEDPLVEPKITCRNAMPLERSSVRTRAVSARWSGLLTTAAALRSRGSKANDAR